MSYILEALKISDRQRHRVTTPTLFTAQATVSAPKQSPVLKYVLAGGLLVGTGIVIGWLRPWEPEAFPVTAPVAAVKLPESGPHQTVATAQAVSPPIGNKQEQKPPAEKSTSAAAPAVPTSALIKQDVVPPARPKKRRAHAKAVATDPKNPVMPAPEKSASLPEKSSPAQEQRVVKMSELPVQVQQELSSMTISVHAYSAQPKNRMVAINDHLLHEGATVAPGLKLEEITPDGMIFTYKGYRFSHRAR
jgi:general secretion pathway protein B